MPQKKPQTEKTTTLNATQLMSKLKTAYGWKSGKVISVKIGTTKYFGDSLKGISIAYKK